MKTFALCVGVLIALSAGAEQPVLAKLVGHRIVGSYPGTPILVCRYAGPTATYEVVASTPICAPYLELN
ncbi:MAG TPA: hypothetical protein VHY75_07605 [Steroidobacteraceae bacterium]|jgi:hypothetical protein|nr:hypothetical protein [Steroidobacteraceae bacterium]